MKERTFNPNGPAAKDSGIFGLPYKVAESNLIIIPIPWDATSYQKSNAFLGPRVILSESKFVELYDKNLKGFYKSGIAFVESSKIIKRLNNKARKLVQKARSNEFDNRLNKIDKWCNDMNSYVFETTKKYLDMNKLVGLIGGDHSISFGSVKAHLDKYPKMGLLQLDAHCDLRNSFEGFTYSNASVMNNILSNTNINKLVQVGVRGMCEEEFLRINDAKDKIRVFYDIEIAERKSKGDSWMDICKEIASCLPSDVYLTCDIDVLTPALCPNTRTPIPGGITYNEIILLLKSLTTNGKKIVGFDIVETSPNENKSTIDGIVSANLLYQLCGWSLRSAVKSF
jgi:agmatinase